jgi:hypothetical protein
MESCVGRTPVARVYSTLSFEQWINAAHIPSEYSWNIILSYCFGVLSAPTAVCLLCSLRAILAFLLSACSLAKARIL